MGDRSALVTSTFQAMGVDLKIAGVGVTRNELACRIERARASAVRWEEMFSRFRPDSELSRVNQASGRSTPVSSEFLAMMEFVIAGVRQSDGRFDPAILPALEHAGYERSFDLIDDDAPVVPAEAPASVPAGWIDEVDIDWGRSTVRIPAGVRLDFGGIAKGVFVDRTVEDLRHWPGGFVDAGGDLRVWGESPNGESWHVGIQDPDDPFRDLALVTVPLPDSGAVATSGSYRRRWRRGTSTVHHLIDPEGGLPLIDRVRSATVIAATVADAEIDTKSLLVAASRGQSLRLLRGHAACLLSQQGTFEILTNDHYTTPSSNCDIARPAA